MWEAREKQDNSQNQSRKSAPKSERKEPEKICFGCGKPGHIKAKNTWSREKKTPVEGHTDKEVLTTCTNGAAAEAEGHSEAEGGNSAAKGTDAMTLQKHGLI